MGMFEAQQFVDECRSALAAADPCAAVRDVLARAVCEPDAIVAALGTPDVAGVQTLHRSAELTVLNVTWAPNMSLHPHNHNMWACIGIYCGREDNVFYRRSRTGLTQHGSKALTAGDTLPLGRDVIHGVSNPLDQFTAALHVYGGDFFTQARSEWDPETLVESPYDVEHTRRVFRDANRRHGLSR